MFSFPYGCYDQYALKKTMARGFKYIFSTEPTDWNQRNATGVIPRYDANDITRLIEMSGSKR